MTGTARSHTPGSCKRCHSHSGVADIAVTRVANHSGPAPPSQTSLSLRAVISAAVKAVMRNFMSPSYEHCPPYPPENANIASLIQIMFTATRRGGSRRILLSCRSCCVEGDSTIACFWRYNRGPIGGHQSYVAFVIWRVSRLGQHSRGCTAAR